MQCRVGTHEMQCRVAQCCQHAMRFGRCNVLRTFRWSRDTTTASMNGRFGGRGLCTHGTLFRIELAYPFSTGLYRRNVFRTFRWSRCSTNTPMHGRFGGGVSHKTVANTHGLPFMWHIVCANHPPTHGAWTRFCTTNPSIWRMFRTTGPST